MNFLYSARSPLPSPNYSETSSVAVSPAFSQSSPIDIDPTVPKVKAVPQILTSTAREPNSTPLLTAHLSSKQACGTIPRPYLTSGLAEDVIKIVTAVSNTELTAEKADSMIHEVTAKILGYDALSPYTNIMLPVLVGETYNFFPFEVIPIILTDGMKACVFLPKYKTDILPIIVFRGTTPKTNFSSVRADAGFPAIIPALFSGEVFPSLEVGRNIVKDNALMMSKLLDSIASNGFEKCILMGHSLGGTLASKFAIADNNLKYVKKLISFNAPGVSRAEVTKYKSLITDKFEAISYQTKGDLVSLVASRKFLGKKITIQPHDIPLTITDLHSHCILSSNHSTINESEAPRPRKLLKAIRILGWITGVNLVLTIAWRIFVLIVPALCIEIYHRCKKDDPSTLIDKASIKYRDQLSSNHQTVLDIHRATAKFYHNLMITGNGHIEPPTSAQQAG